jgi:hypothetical protein
MNIKESSSEARLLHCKTGFNSMSIAMVLGILFFNTHIFALSLSTPVQLSDRTTDSTAATVVSNSSGQVAAIWATWDSSENDNVQAATYISGTWSSPVTLGSGSPTTIGINSSGDTVAGWVNPVYGFYEGNIPQIWEATHDHYTGSWSTVVQLSNAEKLACTPALINDDAGNAIAIWVERCTCTESCNCSLIVCSTYIRSTDTWSAPTYFTSCESHTKRAVSPTLYINSSGQVMAFWAEESSNTTFLSLVGKAYEDGAWNDSTVIASNVEGEGRYHGGIDDDGNSTAIWQAATDDGVNVQAATYSQGNWSSPSIVIDKPIDFVFGYGRGGTGILSWNVNTDDGNIVHAMTYRNGIWGSPCILSSQVGNGGNPCVAAGGGNNGAVMWGNGTDNGSIQIMSLSDGSWTEVLSEPVHLQRSPVVYNLTVSGSQITAVWDDTVDGTNVIMTASGMI